MENELMDTLGANLRELKAAHETLTSQAAIGEKADIDQRTVGRILNAEHAASIRQVAKLAAAFGVQPWQLLAPNLGAGMYRLDGNQIVPVATLPPDGGIDSSVNPRQTSPSRKKGDGWKRVGEDQETPAQSPRRRGQ